MNLRMLLAAVTCMALAGCAVQGQPITPPRVTYNVNLDTGPFDQFPAVTVHADRAFSPAISHWPYSYTAWQDTPRTVTVDNTTDAVLVCGVLVNDVPRSFARVAPGSTVTCGMSGSSR